MKDRLLKWFAGAMLIIVAAIILASVSQAADAAAFDVPVWLYGTIIAGAVQGLVTYGAIKVKIDWIFHRLTALEKKQSDDYKETGARIDEALSHKHHRSTDDCVDAEGRN